MVLPASVWVSGGTSADWTLSGGPENAANVRIRMRYSMALYRVACRVFEKVDSCCIGFDEDKYQAEVRSYCNSFPLRLGHRMVQMVWWDIWKIVTVSVIYGLLNCAGCKYSKVGLPTSCHSTGPQSPILNADRGECL